MDNVLRVKNLKTFFYTDVGVATSVDDVSFDIPAGKTMALVGESGCGKSVTALSIMRLIPSPPGRIVGGSIEFDQKDLARLSEREMRRIRGNGISMIFQEPMTSLNPVFRTGAQVAAAIRVHRKMSKIEARQRTIELFASVGIPAPEERVDDYPHQMSGGMRQRVMIAMALACGPKLLIADEPTTALDVTIQAQILDLLQRLRTERGMSLLLITHDLGVVAETADVVAIMYAGRIIEQAPVQELFRDPMHPYTIGLFKSLPSKAAPSAPGRGRAPLYAIRGTVPAATHFPKGCRFHPRCPYAMDICGTDEPAFIDAGSGHVAACWLHDNALMQRLGRNPGIPGELVEIHP